MLSSWLQEAEDDLEIPEEYMDPITQMAMEDPVVLAATGQMYDYSSLRKWFSMGNRICPRSNIKVTDIQICRVPILKRAINDWKQRNDLEVPQEASTLELSELDASLPGSISQLRSGGTQAMCEGARTINNLHCTWAAEGSKKDSRSKELIRKLNEVIMEDLMWAIRYGDSYLQGVAASALGLCDADDELDWLSACAIVPLCTLLFSSNLYATQAAARILQFIIPRHKDNITLMHSRGAVDGLLDQLLDLETSGYSRSQAARCLGFMASDPECQEEIIAKNGMDLLINLLSESLCRYEQSYSGVALLYLGVTEDDLKSSKWNLHDVELVSFCSHAWLRGEVNNPREGLTVTDRDRLQRLYESFDENILGRLEDPGWLAEAPIDSEHPQIDDG